MPSLFLYEYSVAQPEAASLPDSVRREGRAMFDALREDALALPSVTLVTMNAAISAQRGEVAAFRDAAARADFALIVAPEFDGILEQRCRWATECGCSLLGPSLEAIRLTADKWALYQFWRDQGVATPVTWLSGSEAPCPGPYLRKHRFGAGSLNIERIDCPDRLTTRNGLTDCTRSGPSPETSMEAHPRIIQQFITGVPASVIFLGAENGVCVPMLPCLQLIKDDGTFAYAGGDFSISPIQASRLVRLATAATGGIVGLRGYFGVDAILGDTDDGSKDFALELNPRITTSYLGLRAMCRQNLISIMLSCVQGNSLDPLCWRPERVRFTADGRIVA